MAIGSAAYAAPLAPGQTRMGGRTYLFKPDMFEGEVVETGNVRSTLLELTWPDMNGVNLAAQMEPSRHGRTLLILANSGALSAGAKAAPGSVAGGLRDEFNVAISPHYGERTEPREVADHGQGKSPGGGMTKLARGKMYPNDPALDVWALPPISDPSQFISCTLIQGVFSRSSCSQFFIVDDLLLKVTYDHSLVDQWRLIHDKIAAFLAAAEVNQDGGDGAARPERASHEIRRVRPDEI